MIDLINEDWLRAHHVTNPQIEIFNRDWPTGLSLTRKGLRLLAKTQFSLASLAMHILKNNDYRGLEYFQQNQEAELQVAIKNIRKLQAQDFADKFADLLGMPKGE